MIEVKLRKGEPVERGLRRLKKKMVREGTLKRAYENKYYEKPSRKKYRALKKAKYASKMQSRREAYLDGRYIPPKNEHQELT